MHSWFNIKSIIFIKGNIVIKNVNSFKFLRKVIVRKRILKFCLKKWLWSVINKSKFIRLFKVIIRTKITKLLLGRGIKKL